MKKNIITELIFVSCYFSEFFHQKNNNNKTKCTDFSFETIRRNCFSFVNFWKYEKSAIQFENKKIALPVVLIFSFVIFLYFLKFWNKKINYLTLYKQTENIYYRLCRILFMFRQNWCKHNQDMAVLFTIRLIINQNNEKTNQKNSIFLILLCDIIVFNFFTIGNNSTVQFTHARWFLHFDCVEYVK